MAVEAKAKTDKRTDRLPGPAPVDPVYRRERPNAREVYENKRREDRKPGF